MARTRDLWNLTNSRKRCKELGIKGYSTMTLEQLHEACRKVNAGKDFRKKRVSKTEPVSSSNAKCPSGKVYNPTSGRCVKIGGVVDRKHNLSFIRTDTGLEAKARILLKNPKTALIKSMNDIPLFKLVLRDMPKRRFSERRDALFKALNDDNLSIVKIFLDDGFWERVFDDDKLKVMKYTIPWDKISLRMTKMLLKHPQVDPTVFDNEGITRLAYDKKDLDKFKLFLSDKRVNPVAQKPPYSTSTIANAIRGNNVEAVKLLLADKRVDNISRHAFLDAVQKGNLEIVKLLLAVDDKKLLQARSWFHIYFSDAVNRGDLQLVKLFLKDGRFKPHENNNSMLKSALPAYEHQTDNEGFEREKKYEAVALALLNDPRVQANIGKMKGKDQKQAIDLLRKIRPLPHGELKEIQEAILYQPEGKKAKAMITYHTFCKKMDTMPREKLMKVARKMDLRITSRSTKQEICKEIYKYYN